MSAALSPDFTDVEMVDVSRHFGRRRALARTRLTFQAGEVVALLGPNGSGKSTLLGLLSTLVRPSSGEIQYGGQPARVLGDELRRRIGVLGHDLMLYADLSARENLEFFGRLYGVPDRRARVDAALTGSRLHERADERIAGFSRGMRQRLALERALLNRPRLVLLDEPFTGLDDESSALLVGRLRRLRDEGAIVLLATHEFEHTEALVDRAICLREGRVRELAAGSGNLRDRYRAAMAAEAWT